MIPGLNASDHPVKQTEAIQRAIDSLGESGGTVVVPPGVWTTATLMLRSNLTLRLERGAVIQAHDDLSDYPEQTFGHNGDRQPYHFIMADGVENLTIEGDGVLDGRGELFWERPLRDLKAEGVDISADLDRMPSYWPEDGPFWRGWKPRVTPMLELKHRIVDSSLPLATWGRSLPHRTDPLQAQITPDLQESR